MTFDDLDGFFRTYRKTSAAPGAPFFVIEEFRLEGLRFRILAPYAAEGAPIEEDSGSNSRTVVDGVALDIENGSFHVIHDRPFVTDGQRPFRSSGQTVEWWILLPWGHPHPRLFFRTCSKGWNLIICIIIYFSKISRTISPARRPAVNSFSLFFQTSVYSGNS
jgi:hypothetical protein